MVNKTQCSALADHIRRKIFAAWAQNLTKRAQSAAFCLPICRKECKVSDL